MEHEQAQPLLSEFCDGTLSDESQADLEAHLEQCAECRADLGLLRRTIEAVQRLQTPKAPPKFAARVHRCALRAGLFQTRHQRIARRLSTPLYSSSAMIVLLAAAGGLIVFALLLGQEAALQGPSTLRVEVDSPAEVARAAHWALALGGQALAADRPLTSPVPDGLNEVEIVLPEELWPAFLQALKTTAPGISLPATHAPCAAIRLILTVRAGAP